MKNTASLYQLIINILPKSSLRLGWLHTHKWKKTVNLESEIQRGWNNRGRPSCARAPWPRTQASQATLHGSSRCGWRQGYSKRTPFSFKMHLLAQVKDAGWRRCLQSAQVSLVLTTWELRENREGQYGRSSQEAEGSHWLPCFCTYTFARWSRLGPW